MTIQCEMTLSHAGGTIHLSTRNGITQLRFSNWSVVLAGLRTYRSLHRLHPIPSMQIFLRKHPVEIYLGRLKLMTTGQSTPLNWLLRGLLPR